MACGVIPALSSGPTVPTLPETGGTALLLAVAGAGVLGLGALSAGLSLWRGRRRGRAS